MDELVCLFIYHERNEVTEYHLAQLRAANPGVKVIPATDATDDYIPETFDSRRAKRLFAREGCGGAKKANAHEDTILYAYHLTFPNAYQRIIIAEWDCLINTDLKQYYREVWDKPFASARSVSTEDQPQWWWFQRFKSSAHNSWQDFRGVVPCAGVYFSAEGMDRLICQLRKSPNWYRFMPMSELRLGTAAKRANIEWNPISQLASQQISSTVEIHKVYPQGKGFFHPIKYLPWQWPAVK